MAGVPEEPATVLTRPASASTLSELPPTFFRTVIETANEGIWMIGADGATTFANARMGRMLGLSAEEMLGRDALEFVHPDDLGIANRVIPNTLQGEPQDFEIRFVRADGSLVTVLGGSAAIRDDAGSVIGAVATFSDITAYKKAEQALIESEHAATETATLLNQLLGAAKDAIWMRDAAGIFRVANPAACAIMGGAPADIIGRSVTDIWGPEIGSRLMKETEELFEKRQPITVEEQMLDRASDRTITFLSNKVPLFAANGARIGILGISRDISDRKAAENELRESQVRLASQLAEVNALYESAPIGLAFFDREYRYMRINDELAAINGVPAQAHIGRTIREILPRNAPSVEPLIDKVFATGKAVRDVEVSGETPQQPGVTRHWLTGLYPVNDVAGVVEAVGIWVVEISERKAAEQRELLLAREVDHRAKNLLAVVQSVVQLTQAANADELKAGIVGRIQSLARAHSLLAESRWDGAELDSLVREELAPYLNRSNERVTIDGQPFFLRPAAAQSIALVLHELATNAVKYGALSSPAGKLHVAWRREADGMIEIGWDESGGPPVVEPQTSGFGSKIIRASIERQLRGAVQYRWRAEGLHCVMRLPAVEAVSASK